MSWAKDITGVDAKKQGSYRSLNGAADENIFTGRASKAGFFCFFKVWRDMPYDAVLDYNGVLYRVEVKGSSQNKFQLTRGSRSGRQINPGMSRERVLGREDCDFAVGVDSGTGECYIIPEDIIEAVGAKSLSTKTLDDFNERWKLLMPNETGLTEEETRDGICKKSLSELNTLAGKLGIALPATVKIPHTQVTLTDPHDVAVYTIWDEIAKKVKL